MRLAVVTDVHGNLTALETIVADIRRRAVDRVVHGGDLALMGRRPAEVIDRICELGWQGVLGNTDETSLDLCTISICAVATPAPASIAIAPASARTRASTLVCAFAASKRIELTCASRRTRALGLPSGGASLSVARPPRLVQADEDLVRGSERAGGPGGVEFGEL